MTFTMYRAVWDKFPAPLRVMEFTITITITMTITEPAPVAIYTPSTLAKRWQCSERHVRNLIDDGTLPAFRLGEKLLRIRGEDVDALERARAAVAVLSPAPAIDSSAEAIQTKKKRRPPSARLDTLGGRAKLMNR